jgi:hypothetical protein
VVTDADGIATFTSGANQHAGTFLLRARIAKSEAYAYAYLTFYNAPADSQDPDYPIVEFYSRGRNHYFMTGDAQEMLKLDSGIEWERTGGAFMAFVPGTQMAELHPVCRFYGLPQAGLDSHFFSASAQECADVESKFGNSWILETPEAFQVFFPDTKTGACQAGTVQVFRTYNNRPDANHEYGTFLQYLSGSSTWTHEGYGPGVVMCAPL